MGSPFAGKTSGWWVLAVGSHLAGNDEGGAIWLEGRSRGFLTPQGTAWEGVRERRVADCCGGWLLDLLGDGPRRVCFRDGAH